MLIPHEVTSLAIENKVDTEKAGKNRSSDRFSVTFVAKDFNVLIRSDEEGPR